jgi:glycosyltransferase involved in cell wall biosynthesis
MVKNLISEHRCLKYVLITPARNEEAFIEKTIQSVIAQTILPKKWIIVSDGSTDRTDNIVAHFTEKYPWIELVRMPEHRDRQFAAKVHCFNAGYSRLQELDYEIIGNLDADISFEEDYFEFLLEKFAMMPGLGVAGTPSSKTITITTIELQILSTSQEPASFSKRSVSKISEDMFRSRQEGLTGLPSPQPE